MSNPNDEIESETAKGMADVLASIGLTQEQANELGGTLAQMSVTSAETRVQLGWMAMLLLLEGVRPNSVDAAMSVEVMRLVAKKMIRKDLRGILPAQAMLALEHALESRWSEVVAVAGEWKKAPA